MKIRLTSDIHNEFFRDRSMVWKFPELDTDSETVLVLAGDSTWDTAVRLEASCGKFRFDGKIWH